MQPLYLNASEVRRVSLEGPALKVVCRHQADQYFPLARLSRVISLGPVSWSSAALLECLRRRVPITLLDREGQLVGMCFGAWPQDSKFNALLDAFCALEDGLPRLKDWFRAQSRQRLLALLRRHKLRPSDLRVQVVREFLAFELKRRKTQADASLLWRLIPLTLAHVAEILTSYQIQPAVLEPSHDWRGLAGYLTGLLEWEWWEWALTGVLHPTRSLDQRSVVACYEHHARAVEERTRDWIGRLWRWLEQSEAYSA